MVEQRRSGVWGRLPNATQRQYLKTGFIDFIPAMVATAVWAFVTGIAMVKSGLTESIATAMTLMVYAGSAQLTSLPLIESNAPLWLIFAAGFIVNIRFIIFGAALYPFFRHLSFFKRLVLGYITTDMVFVLFMKRYAESKQRSSSEHVWYFLGVVVPGWFTWQAFSLLGIYFGAMISDAWSLEYAAMLALLAILLPLVVNRPLMVCLIVAGAIAWVGQLLPLRLGLVLAVIGGVVAGVVVEQLQNKRKAP